MSLFSYTQYVHHLVAEGRLELNTKQVAFLAKQQGPKPKRSFKYPKFLISQQLRLKYLESTHLFEAKQVACSLPEAKEILYGNLPLIRNKLLTVPVGAALYLIDALFSKAESANYPATTPQGSIVSLTTTTGATSNLPSETGSETPPVQTPPTSASHSQCNFPVGFKEEAGVTFNTRDAAQKDAVTTEAKEVAMALGPMNTATAIGEAAAVAHSFPPSPPPPTTITSEGTLSWRRNIPKGVPANGQGNSISIKTKGGNPRYSFKHKRPLLHAASWRR